MRCLPTSSACPRSARSAACPRRSSMTSITSIAFSASCTPRLHSYRPFARRALACTGSDDKDMAPTRNSCFVSAVLALVDHLIQHTREVGQGLRTTFHECCAEQPRDAESRQRLSILAQHGVQRLLFWEPIQKDREIPFEGTVQNQVRHEGKVPRRERNQWL